MIHRLIAENWATRQEINTSYTFMDIVEANAVLDLRSAIEEAVTEMTRPKPPGEQ
jgi:hypothetical protein